MNAATTFGKRRKRGEEGRREVDIKWEKNEWLQNDRNGGGGSAGKRSAEGPTVNRYNVSARGWCKLLGIHLI